MFICTTVGGGTDYRPDLIERDIPDIQSCCQNTDEKEKIHNVHAERQHVADPAAVASLSKECV